jgi:hypothetical protein
MENLIFYLIVQLNLTLEWPPARGAQLSQSLIPRGIAHLPTDCFRFDNHLH